jgi:hypothetical protein
VERILVAEREREREKERKKYGCVEGGGLVGVVLDADDLARPHGQHLPQPLLAGLVAVLVAPVGAHVEDDLVAGLDGLAEVGPYPVVVLAAEGLQDLLTVVAVPRAGCGGQPLDLRVEHVHDGVDTVTAGALVGGLQEVEVLAHGSSNGIVVLSG